MTIFSLSGSISWLFRLIFPSVRNETGGQNYVREKREIFRNSKDNRATFIYSK